MKELQTTINSLTGKIELLVIENSELRDNYWKLNQSLLKVIHIVLHGLFLRYHYVNLHNNQ